MCITINNKFYHLSLYCALCPMLRTTFFLLFSFENNPSNKRERNRSTHRKKLKKRTHLSPCIPNSVFKHKVSPDFFIVCLVFTPSTRRYCYVSNPFIFAHQNTALHYFLLSHLFMSFIS